MIFVFFELQATQITPARVPTGSPASARGVGVALAPWVRVASVLWVPEVPIWAPGHSFRDHGGVVTGSELDFSRDSFPVFGTISAPQVDLWVV